jgi:F-type H+-transporting ATPase subunit b
MMQAWAAEQAAIHAEPFYAAPEFWVMVAFFIFVAGAFRPAYRIITAALDDRSDRIQRQIDEATRLREEAQDLLAGYQRKQADAEREAEEMLARAREEADRLRERGVAELEQSLDRRRQQAEDRIQQAEAKAIDEVRRLAVDIAIEATRSVLVERTTGDKADALIDDAIKELPDKIH